MKSLGLRAALTLLVLIGFAPVFGVVVQSSLAQQHAGLQRAEERLASLVEAAALQQEALVESTRLLLTAIAHAPPVYGDDVAACARYLKALQAEYPPDFGVFGMLDVEGILTCRVEAPPATVHSDDREFFREAVDHGRFAVGGYTVSRASGRKVLPFGQPVYEPAARRLRGVAYAAVDTAHASRRMQQIAAASDATLLVTDDRRIVLAAAGALPPAVGSVLPPQEFSDASADGKPKVGSFRDAGGRRWLHATRLVGRPGERKLFVAGKVPRDRVLAPLARQLEMQLAALSAITLAAAVLAWVFADRVLLRPMRGLLARVQSLAREDQRLDQPPSTAVLREFNELHSRFHTMARSLAQRAVLRDAAMAEMEHQRLLLEAVLESMSEAVLVIDRQGRFVHVNGAALRILPGLRPPGQAGAGSEAAWSLRSIDGAGETPAQERPAARALRGEPVERFRYRVGGELAGGRDKVIEGSAWPLAMPGPVVDGAVLLFGDATEAWAAEEARARAEEALRDLNETLEHRVQARTRELAAANRELESFSYSVSHDLRAPLQVIDGFARALESRHGDRLDGQARHYLDRICENTRQMGQLIDDLLNLARVTRAELRPESADLALVAQRVVAQLHQRFPQRSVQVEIERPLPCRCDPRLLAIVLENLIGNAWKFTAKVPMARIRIGRQVSDGRAEFFVADNGAGFDMAYADKLFNAFQRLHNESEFEGTGIGLATVHRIVTRHGGRVRAESVPGEGSTFYFTLEAEGETA